MANISVQFRRGTDTEHSSFTGAEGEVTVDTTNDTLRVHDGTTAGGVRLAKLGEVNVNVQSDWDETNTGSDAFILNKPTIPTTTDSVQTGTVSAFAGSAAPTGYLLCNGAAVNRTTQAALFAVIGTTYGVGDGSTTFDLPDLQGRVIAGMGGSLLSGTDAVGDEGGVKEHTLTIDQMPSHTHAGTIQSGLQAGSGSGRLTNDAGNVTGATGGGQAHPNVQPTMILNYIIKT
jgi:microcystin-dependent protein